MTVTSDDLRRSAEIVAAELATVRDLAERAGTYYTGTVTPENVAYWLLQFGDPSVVRSLLRLLPHIHFVDNNQLVELLLGAFRKVPESDRATARFSTIGRAFDSSSLVSYGFAKALGLTEQELATRWISPEQLGTLDVDAPIVLLDDNICSGVQLTRFISEIFPDHAGEREHLNQPLSASQIEQLKRTQVYVAVAVELGPGKADVERIAGDKGLSLLILTGRAETTQSIQYGGPISRSREESLLLSEALCAVARQLVADKPWSPATVEDRLLGYGNRQTLTTFAHNAPKSLLTVMWKAGTYSGRPWVPLFPERAEWGKYENDIRRGDPALRLLAEQIVSGALGERRPSLSVSIERDGQSLSDVPATFGTTESAERLRGVAMHGRSPATPYRRGGTRGLSPLDGALSIDTFISESAMKEHQRDVERYNRELEGFERTVLARATAALRFLRLPLRIQNQGNGPATGIVVHLFLPDGVNFETELPVPPTPPWPPRDPSPIPDRSLELSALMSDLRPRVPQVPSAWTVTIAGKTAVEMELDSIAPRGFRDKDLAYLVLPRVADIALQYQIVCNEQSQPATGTLLIRAVPTAGFIPEFVHHAWRSALDS